MFLKNQFENIFQKFQKVSKEHAIFPSLTHKLFCCEECTRKSEYD